MPVRTADPPAQPPSEFTLKELAVRRIFSQVSTSYANHRKNLVALYRIQDEYASQNVLFNRGNFMKLTGDRKFERLFQELLLTALRVKKGVTEGDRLVKFVAGYTRFLNEKFPDEDDDEEGTMASRFTSNLLKFILPGFVAKDKNVRFRVSQLTTEMVTHMGPINEELFNQLRAALIGRLHDRESAVRSQAVIALAHLSVLEDPDDHDGERSILEVLLDTMSGDSSAEVRRSALLNIPIDSQTLPGIFDRMQDIDPSVRKAVYSKKLAVQRQRARGEDGEDIDGTNPVHPLQLTVSQRELVVQSGLADRDSSVSGAAAALIKSWVESLAEVPGLKAEDGSGSNYQDLLLSFLTLFDLQKGSIAQDALKSVLKSMDSTVGDGISFDETYWASLTPQKAFFARVFVERCKEEKDEARLETALPVVTRIAFLIQEAYNNLDDSISEIKADNEQSHTEIVLAELVKLATYLDYSDEIGRRKTLELVRCMLSSETLPLQLLGPCLDLLSDISASEGDLIKLVVESIAELRDSNGVGDTPEPSEEEALRLEIAYGKPRQTAEVTRNNDASAMQKLQNKKTCLRCLKICIVLLERIYGAPERNITLQVLLKSQILPSVRDEDSAIKEQGVRALGLYCLISKPLAVESFPFFINGVSFPDLPVKIAFSESAYDILMSHGTSLFKDSGITLEFVTNILVTNILKEAEMSAKAIFCEGMAKLLLSGLIKSIEVLQTLIKVYFSPLTSGNSRLRQCLAIFFPRYAHSSLANQRNMAEAFIHVFLDVCEDRKNARDADGDVEGTDSAMFVNIFADWTNPLHLMHILKAAEIYDEKAVDLNIQLEMAEDILKVLFEKDIKVSIEKNDKRALCQLLCKLHIPDIVDDYRIRSLKLLIDTLQLRCPLRDSASRIALSKFDSAISEKFKEQLEGFTEEDYRKLEELTELFEFLDSVIPFEDDEHDSNVRRKRRKRRSESIVTVSSNSRSCSPAPRKNVDMHKNKRAKLSTPNQDNEDVKASIVPQRIQPKHARASKAPADVIVISSDSDEELMPKSLEQNAHMDNEEAELDRQLNRLLISAASSSGQSEIPFDSIIDTEEEEEEEVNELLVTD